MPSSGSRARRCSTPTRGTSRAEDLQRLFTHDTRDAYRFFTRGQDDDRFAGLPLWKSAPLRLREFFIAFTLRLSPARRVLYLGALVIALTGDHPALPRIRLGRFPVRACRSFRSAC